MVNLSEKDYIKKKNKWLAIFFFYIILVFKETPKFHISYFFRLIKIKEWVDKNDPGAIIIPFSGVFENKIADMPLDEQQAYLNENKTTRFIIIYDLNVRNLR